MDANASDQSPADASQPVRGATALLRDILTRLDDKAAQTAPQFSDEGEAKEAASRRSASLGDVLDLLDERAFGFLMLLLALPCCLPFVYLLPQIVSLPMLALAGQLAAGRRHPWFPRSIRNRRFAIDDFRQVLDRSEKYVGWVENIARPRLRFVTGHLGSRLVGLLMLAPAASIMLPIPSTNTIPGIGVALASLGLIERDGVLVIGGLLIGFAWITLLLVLGVEAASIIKDFISNLV